MIPIGQVCEECHKIHLIKPMSELDNLSPSIRVKTYKTRHRIFDAGYYASLDMNNEISHQLETWEFYLPLSVFKLERIQEEEPEEDKDLERYVNELYEIEEEEDS